MFSRLKLFCLFTVLALVFSSCTKILLNHHVSKYNKYNGIVIPDFILEDIDGNKINTADFRGKTILLNTWGTWCSPCLNEMPGLNYIHQKLSDQPDFLLLNICAKSDKEQWRKVVAEKQLKGINLYMPDSLFKTYNVFNIDNEGWPYNIILGKDGRILGGGIDVEAEGENLLTIYALLKATDNMDAKASTSKLISFAGKMKNIDKPEMKEFKDFFGKYVDTTKVKASGTFFQ